MCSDAQNFSAPDNRLKELWIHGQRKLALCIRQEDVEQLLSGWDGDEYLAPHTE